MSALVLWDLLPPLDGRFQCYVFSGCEWRQDCSSSFSGENFPASAESGTAAASKNTPDGNLPASVATGAATLQEPLMPWPCDEEIEAMMDDAFEFSCDFCGPKKESFMCWAEKHPLP